jgi:hypothetical protein
MIVATYPYTSGQSALVQTFAQLRKGFPAKFDAGYLQRFKIAPANESYIISILRFLGLIDENGDQIGEATSYFFGGDDAFKAGLEAALRDAYSTLVGEMGDAAFTAEKENLTHWFRAADKTSALVGQRQASTFQTLAALAGHGDVPNVRATGTRKVASTPSPSAAKTNRSNKKNGEMPPPSGEHGAGDPPAAQDVGLTVRIEVNLPPDGDAATYDAIFASMKKHLLS